MASHFIPKYILSEIYEMIKLLYNSRQLFSKTIILFIPVNIGSVRYGYIINLVLTKAEIIIKGNIHIPSPISQTNSHPHIVYF